MKGNGSAQLTGGAPGLQIRCEALKPSRVGSIPMHFRHISNTYLYFFVLQTSSRRYNGGYEKSSYLNQRCTNTILDKVNLCVNIDL